MLSIPWHVRWHNGCMAQRVWCGPLSRTRMGSIGVATRSTGGHKRSKAKRVPKLKVKEVQGKTTIEIKKPLACSSPPTKL